MPVACKKSRQTWRRRARARSRARRRLVPSCPTSRRVSSSRDNLSTSSTFAASAGKTRANILAAARASSGKASWCNAVIARKRALRVGWHASSAAVASAREATASAASNSMATCVARAASTSASKASPRQPRSSRAPARFDHIADASLPPGQRSAAVKCCTAMVYWPCRNAAMPARLWPLNAIPTRRLTRACTITSLGSRRSAPTCGGARRLLHISQVLASALLRNVHLEQAHSLPPASIAASCDVPVSSCAAGSAAAASAGLQNSIGSRSTPAMSPSGVGRRAPPLPLAPASGAPGSAPSIPYAPSPAKTSKAYTWS